MIPVPLPPNCKGLISRPDTPVHLCLQVLTKTHHLLDDSEPARPPIPTPAPQPTHPFVYPPPSVPQVLTKTYHLLDDSEPVLEKAEGCTIDWKTGKNCTVKVRGVRGGAERGVSEGLRGQGWGGGTLQGGGRRQQTRTHAFLGVLAGEG
jgi:hypothetical protein